MARDQCSDGSRSDCYLLNELSFSLFRYTLQSVFLCGVAVKIVKDLPNREYNCILMKTMRRKRSTRMTESNSTLTWTDAHKRRLEDNGAVKAPGSNLLVNCWFLCGACMLFLSLQGFHWLLPTVQKHKLVCKLDAWMWKYK